MGVLKKCVSILVDFRTFSRLQACPSGRSTWTIRRWPPAWLTSRRICPQSGDRAMTRGSADRYSFHGRDFHSLHRAGFHRRYRKLG